MNALFAVTAVRAATRIGRTAADAFEQYAQERPILLPDADRVGADPLTYVRRVAREHPGFARLLAEDPELSKLWHDGRPTPVADALDAVYTVAWRYETRAADGDDGGSSGDAAAVAGGVMVGQWAAGKGPLRPWARILVAMTDVALEYLGAHPQVLGIGGNGEKLVGAIAAALARSIPDDDDRASLGPRERFAQRLAAAALHAGLDVASRRPDLVFDDEHLQALLDSALPPVLAALPLEEGDLGAQVQWNRVTEALLGPALGAALETAAARPAAFLGRGFAPERALGVMVTGLLRAAADQGRDERFSRRGLLELFRCGARIAAANPELVLGELLDEDLSDPVRRSAAEEAALRLFTAVAGTLRDRHGPLGDDLGMAIAVASLDALRDTGRVLLDPSRPWEAIAGTVLAQVLDGLADGLASPDGRLAATVFGGDGLVDLARVFVEQVAATPHMVVGDDGELARVVSSVARAMAADRRLLLTRADWRAIAAVAAQEAALNPGRLFGLNDASPDGRLAASLMTRLLSAAGDNLARPAGERGRPVMLGDTLRQAMVVTLRAAASNVLAASRHAERIEALARALDRAVDARALSLGGKEWLRLFRTLLPRVLETGAVPELDDASIAALLHAGSA